jgi:hypothetical protein
LRFDYADKAEIISEASTADGCFRCSPHGEPSRGRAGNDACKANPVYKISLLIEERGQGMTETVVTLRLNQQQLELMDRTIAQGVAADRVALVRLALREYAAAREAEKVTEPAR